MLNSTRQKCFFCPIIYIILITFLWSNLVWAYPGLDTDKLQPSSNVTALVPIADTFATGQEAIRRLTDVGISSKDAFYKGLEDKLKKGKIGSLSGIPCLVFSDPDDPSKLAYYVFNPKEAYFSRITTHPEVKDSLWNFLKLTDIDKRVFPDVRVFKEKGREYYQYIFAMTDGELEFINTCLRMTFQDWQIKDTGINSFDAKISRCERGIEVGFNPMDKYPVSTSPVWNMAGWAMRFAQLAPGAKLEIDKSSGKNYVKVITGELTNINRGAFTYVKGKRDTLVAEDYIQAGDTGAIVAIMVKTDNAPDEIKDVDQVKITGPMAELLNWRACEEYEWGGPFKDMPFYNIHGFRIKNGEGKDVCYVQFWAAGKGVNCGVHDHSETDADTTFCEIHLGLFNGTGNGGMVYLDAEGNEVYLPIREGEEHGPFWDINPDTGEAIRRENGAVMYGKHRWQGGGERVERLEDESFDIWAVFEIPPDEAIIKNTKSAGLLRNTPWGAKLLYPNSSEVWEYSGRQFSVQPRWVPESTKGTRQVIGEDELMRLVLSPGWKVVITRNYDEMTYAALYIIVNLMEMVEREFCFGLATGGTTESLRKAMGLIDLSRQILDGLSVPIDKIKIWETLDNYYWPVGSDPRTVAIASYFQEQNYMLLENLYGEKLGLERFVAPPDVTGMSWQDTALDFYRRMRIFMDDAHRILVQLHGVGSSGHDAFNEVFIRLKRSTKRIVTDLRRYVDIPEFEEVPSFYYEMGLMRPDHGTVCLDITKVQNIGHIIERSFHPFFLRFMADNLLYSIPELLARLSTMSIEEIATYYPEPKYRFISEQDFIRELQYLLDNYKLTPRLAITQGTGDTALRTAHPDSLNMVMVSSPHKQEPLRRAVELKPSAFCTASWLQLAANAIVVATEDSAGAIDWSKCFLFEPRNRASSLCTEAKIEGEWEKTKPGERIQTLIKGGEDVGLTKDSHEIPEYNFAISKIKELMAKKQFREEEIDRFLDELIGLLPNLGVVAELLEIAFKYLFMVDGAKDEVYYYHSSLIEGLPELLKIYSTPKDRARILKGKISDLKEELSKESRDKDAIITRNIFSWLARANEEVAEVKIPADSFGEYSIEVTPNASRRIVSFSIEPFVPEDEGLMEEWYAYAKRNRMGFNVPKFYEWKDAIRGCIKGFKLVTIDVQGKKRIEGWVIYEEVIGEGLFESYRENAPWNGPHVKDKEIKGVATAIIKRVIEESVHLGYNGRLISIPSTDSGFAFAKTSGKKPNYTPSTQYGRVSWAYWTLSHKSALEFLEGYSKKCAQLGRRVMTVKRDNILHYADIARRTHETLPEELTRDLSCSFRMIDPTSVSLRDILVGVNFENAVLFESENISVQYNKGLKRIFIKIVGDDKRRVEGGIDRFNIYISLTDSYTIKHIEWMQIYYMLSCSELSLILEKTDFKQKFPILFEVIKKQFVLPDPNEEIAAQERIAGGAIVLSEYEERASKGLIDKDFISNVALLRYSKSWEIRQKGLKILRYLRGKGTITEEEMARFEGLFFAEDIKEDLRYLERFLRNDEEYIRQTFKNLFNRDITLSEIYNSEVTIRFLGRGFNKQIYKVQWRLGPDEVYVFAVSTIRDAQLGQGNFSADAINTALGHWERLSRDRNPYVPVLGAARWLKDYQPKSVRLERHEIGVANDICVVSREFVEGINLEQVLGDKNIPEEERGKARLAGLGALLGIWRFSRDKDGKGTFMTTPKPNDVVVFKGSNGQWQAKIVDMDALEDGMTRDKIVEVFKLYPWCSIGLAKRLLYWNSVEGPKVVSIGGGNGPKRLAMGMAGYTDHMTNIITVFDNWGSTGVFRDFLDIPAVGDIRNRLSSLLHLVPAGRVLEGVFDYRLPDGKGQDELIGMLKGVFLQKEAETGELIPKVIRKELEEIINYYISNFSNVPLKNMCVGNIIIIGEYFRCGKNLGKAVNNILKLLGLDKYTEIIPITEANLDIAAQLANKVIYGEHQIAHRADTYASIYDLFFVERGKKEKVAAPEANPIALKRIEEADAIVIGPGSLHTSCMPNLKVKGVPEAIKRSKGAKILVINLMEYNEREGIWETRGYKASRIVEEVLRSIRSPDTLYTDYIRYVLVNNHGAKDNYIPVDVEEIRKMGLEVIVKDLEDKDSPGYHDPEKLSQAVMEIVERHKNLSPSDLINELRYVHGEVAPPGFMWKVDELYERAFELYMRILDTCDDPKILLEAWRIITTYQRYVVDHYDPYADGRPVLREIRGPEFLKLQQDMLRKIRDVKDLGPGEVAVEIENNIRVYGMHESEKMVLFSIYLRPNGMAKFQAMPARVNTYSGIIHPEGPHAAPGYTDIKKVDTEFPVGGFIRGVLSGETNTPDGFVRLDPPIGDFAISEFLKVKLGKAELTPEDYEQYEHILFQEVIGIIRFLAEAINLDKQIILYDSIKGLFRKQGILVPDRITLGVFIRLISDKEIPSAEGVSDIQIPEADTTEKGVVVGGRLGLHYRLDARISKCVSDSKYDGLEVFIKRGSDIASARKLAELLKIGAKAGESVDILVSGGTEGQRREIIDAIRNILKGEPVLDEPDVSMPKKISTSELVVREVKEESAVPEIIGNKGANLVELSKLVRVPEAFFVTTNAYGLFIEKSGLLPLIKELDGLYQLLKNDKEGNERIKDTIRRKCEVISNAIVEKQMPEELERKVRDEYRALCTALKVKSLRLAVRSSSTLEDLLGVSFAGIYRSFSDVNTEGEMIRAIKGVWASLFSQRAVMYYANLIEEGKNVPGYSSIRQAVVVQRMIESAISGGVYTVDHSTGEQAIYIEASYGMGKHIVSGMVTPDAWLLKDEENGLKIVKHIIRRKLTKMDPMQDGKVVSVDILEQDKACLSEEKIFELAQGVAMIRGYYGEKYAYIDVEYVFSEDGNLYFLQVRPTTVVPSPGVEEADRIDSYKLEGIVCSPGIAEGKIMFVETADDLPDNVNTPCILVFNHADSDSLKILFRALDRYRYMVSGVMTKTGGRTSHFAEVVREMGLPYISGVEDVREIYEGDFVRINSRLNCIEVFSLEGLYEYAKKLAGLMFFDLDMYFRENGISSLSEKIEYLLNQQREAGFVMTMGEAGVEYFEINYETDRKTFSMKVQFNPRRMNRLENPRLFFARYVGRENLLAGFGRIAEELLKRMDTKGEGALQMVSEIKALSKRMREVMAEKEERQTNQCNLCPEWQVQVEKGFSFRNFIVYPNPFPYVDGLVTIAYKDHILQRPFDLESMMGFAKAVGYKVLFNSQNAGPTVPEHTHFQAFPSPKILPAEMVGRERLKEDDGIEIFGLDKDYPVKMLVVEGKNRRKVSRNIRNIIRYLEKSGFGYNLLIKEENGQYQVYIVPRLAEQPSEYFSKFATFEMFGELVSVYKKEELFRKIGEEEFEKVIIEALQKATISSDDYERLCSFVKSGEIYIHKVAEKGKAPSPSQPPVAGPVGKKVKAGAEYAEFWEAEVKGTGLGEWKACRDAGKRTDIKPEGLNGLYSAVVKRLTDEYGPGILAVVDKVRLVDNIDADKLAKGEGGIVPYAMMVKEDGKNILLLDIDAFSDEELLYIVLEHEFKESIMTIVPCENDAVRELTTNYMSLKLALKKGIRIDKEKIRKLGADLQFFEALEVLQAMKGAGEKITDEVIIAVAIEIMRAMPYYAGLFRQFSFAEEWEAKIRGAENRYHAAVRVFNEIMDAKEGLEGTVEEVGINIKVINTFTGKMRILGLEGLPGGLQQMIGAMAKQVYSMDRFAGQLTRSTDTKYILVDENRLKELKEVIGGEKYKEIERNLNDNNYIITTQVPQGVVLSNVIRLVDPADLRDMPQTEGMLYLPMPYTRSSFYMAANIVSAGGRLEGIDRLIQEIIKGLYSQILGEPVTEDNLIKLFTQPWEFLPEIKRVLDDLNRLDTAVMQIEKAA